MKLLRDFFSLTSSKPKKGTVGRYESRKFCKHCGAPQYRTSTEVGPLELDDCKGWPKYDPQSSTHDALWKVGPLKKWFGTDRSESAWFKCLLKAHCLACAQRELLGSSTTIIFYARPKSRCQEVQIRVKNLPSFAPVLAGYRFLKERFLFFRTGLCQKLRFPVTSWLSCLIEFVRRTTAQ